MSNRIRISLTPFYILTLIIILALLWTKQSNINKKLLNDEQSSQLISKKQESLDAEMIMKIKELQYQVDILTESNRKDNK